MMHRASLRRKMTTVVFGAIGCTLVLCSIGLAWFEYRAAETRIRTALEVLAQATFGHVTPAIRYGLQDVAGRGLARLEADSFVKAAALFWKRPDGGVELFARYTREGETAHFAPEARPDGFYLAGGRALLVTTRSQAGEPDVTLQIEASLAAARRSVTEVLKMLGVVLVLLLAVGAVLTRILQRAVTRPILALAETAARVHLTGDYSVRAAVSSRDEVSQLAVTMNEMLSGIAARDRNLAESSAFQQAILENAGVSIITTSPDARILSFNAAAERMLGYRKDEVIGRATPELIHAPEELQRAAAELSRLLGREVPASHQVFVELARERPHAGEWIYVRKDGARFPVFLVVSTLRTPAGEVLGLCGIATDLTERKASEEAIRRLNAELERRVAERTAQLAERVGEVEKLNSDLRASQQAADRAAARLQEANANLLVANQELEAFTYSVSHDLRAPLRNVSGFVELLRKRLGAQLDAEAQRFLGIVTSETVRMGTLIDDLLTFSRVGRAQMWHEEIHISELLDEVRRELASEIEGRRIEWVVGEMPPVKADRTLLRQVLVNLVGNAAKFTRQRDPARIEIGVRPRHQGENVLTFFVRDNGAGFNPQYVDKLFRVFQRLHNTREFEGTGIGLANVKRIITRHGGRVWAEGQVDAGATFYFTLKDRKDSA